VSGPGDKVGSGRKEERLMGCSSGSGVSESELLAAVSDRFGVGRVSDGGVQSTWFWAGASRISREQDRGVSGSGQSPEPLSGLQIRSE